jgi:uncharacterized membrane protein YozB (DUF420 family)
VSHNVWFWSAALANMALALTCTYFGVARIRRGRIAEHRRFMLTAAGLVGLFLVSYVAKVILVGREDFSTWTLGERGVLWFHEACVFTMLAAGAWAVFLATQNRFADADLERPAKAARSHRRAGRTAIVAATVGLGSAAVVLWRMFQHA